MKKLFSLLLSIALVLVISGCNFTETKNGRVNDAKIEGSTCDTLECFEKQFASCESGESLLITVDSFITYYREIIGPKSGKCEMLSVYKKNPNPAYVDKDFICLYDNTKSLTEAEVEVLDAATKTTTSGCSGALYDYYQSLYLPE